MDVFKTTTEHEGRTFIVRPLCNIKELNVHSFKLYFNMMKMEWEYRYICLALIDDELRVFMFNKKILNIFLNNKLFSLGTNNALKITVSVKFDFVDNQCEIISDDKYCFDNTSEKKEYITNLLSSTDISLTKSLKELQTLYRDTIIELPNTSDYKNPIKIMIGEIYDKDEINEKS